MVDSTWGSYPPRWWSAACEELEEYRSPVGRLHHLARVDAGDMLGLWAELLPWQPSEPVLWVPQLRRLRQANDRLVDEEQDLAAHMGRVVAPMRRRGLGLVDLSLATDIAEGDLETACRRARRPSARARPSRLASRALENLGTDSPLIRLSELDRSLSLSHRTRIELTTVTARLVWELAVVEGVDVAVLDEVLGEGGHEGRGAARRWVREFTDHHRVSTSPRSTHAVATAQRRFTVPPPHCHPPCRRRPLDELAAARDRRAARASVQWA
ncbi:hypothetical protein [uncultured Pseudokineococcus sp.]|uniref:hypothetical protein n=1 Tax=uncultured Pseudokineococcus sp. TaxID=1642928 RepID=UPI0026016039|nr:hypothetical protein [uncultured Pseudokineococcus sp.]